MRQGQCKRCGRCCQLRALSKELSFKAKFLLFLIQPQYLFAYWRDIKCPFLGFDYKGQAYCKNYINRPPWCKLFPSTPADLIDTECGYYFK